MFLFRVLQQHYGTCPYLKTLGFVCSYFLYSQSHPSYPINVIIGVVLVALSHNHLISYALPSVFSPQPAAISDHLSNQDATIFQRLAIFFCLSCCHDSDSVLFKYGSDLIPESYFESLYQGQCLVSIAFLCQVLTTKKNYILRW